MRTGMRGMAAAAAAAGLAGVLTVAGGPTAGAAAGAPDARAGDTGPAAYALAMTGRFAPPQATIPSNAVTYDQKAVPAGAGVHAAQTMHAAEMRIGLAAHGLLPNRTYGAHIHTKPCGAGPDDSGPHYQHRPDPRQPSTDPAYANPRNEVWLDFTTDEHGAGKGEAVQNWRFRAGGARSVVLHEHGTEKAHGKAGQAGARLACFTVPFGPRG